MPIDIYAVHESIHPSFQKEKKTWQSRIFKVCVKIIQFKLI